MPCLVVGIVNADHDLHLRLAPEAVTVGRAKLSAGIEISLLQLAATAKQLNPGIVISFFAKIGAGTTLEPKPLGTGYLVLGPKLHPFSARTDAVLLVLVGAQSTSLGVHADRRSTSKRQEQKPAPS